MTPNYRMIVEKVPKPNGVVGGSIPDREIVSTWWKLTMWSSTFYVPKKNRRRRRRRNQLKFKDLRNITDRLKESINEFTLS